MPSILSKIWNLKPQAAPAGLSQWAGQLGVTEFLARLLYNRGLTTPEAMDVYLSPGLRHLCKPEDIPGLAGAARVLAQGLTEGKRLAVWGDYDVDGLTATSLMLEFLRSRGFDPLWHIPNRRDEGYGLNAAGIEELARAGAQMLLTVDCGITNPAEAARARELGLTVVITDHHLPHGPLPDAQAVCNPRLAPCGLEHLAGVGVAFFLAAAVNRLLPGEPADVRSLLDLVALGVLADVVSLTGVNRVLVKNGLLLINEAARPGIYALKEASSFHPRAKLGAGQVVFGLAPRINAAGRMGEADAALNLLLAADLETARPLANALDRQNRLRREEEELIREQAMAQAAEQGERMGLVLYAPGWRTGIIGIVASRVAEAANRPVLILADERGLIKGSGRGVADFDLFAALGECREALAGFGGHRQAAGLSLDPQRLGDLRLLFDAAVRRQLGDSPAQPKLTIDAELEFSAIDHTLVKELDLMQPFGMGNPEPVFRTGGLILESRREFGANHLLLELRDPASGLKLRAKAWRMAEKFAALAPGKTLALAHTPRLDQYRGLDAIELRVKDVLME
ncbi:MAG: single-stranded-DNA-specific exonuclease RecJ [Desulfovibrionaceae bacterium]|nr:single-stranded-DNA-specific exonuclease RecJ [Desulfovibrionaceae bacterium]MBF0513851.1 single-stranded-DNA-specific exonuclease RecJ [Desulfovibrionaceae bacterium]